MAGATGRTSGGDNTNTPNTGGQEASSNEPKASEPKATEPEATEPKATDPEARERADTPPDSKHAESTAPETTQGDAGDQRYTVEERVHTDEDGYTSSKTVTNTVGDTSTTVTERTVINDDGVTRTTTRSHTDGPVTHEVEQSQSIGDDGVGVAAEHRLSVGEQTLSETGAEYHAGDGDVSGRVYHENLDHSVSVDGGVQTDPGEVVAGIEGTVDGHVTGVAGEYARHADADGVDQHAEVTSTTGAATTTGYVRTHVGDDEVDASVRVESAVAGVDTGRTEARVHVDTDDASVGVYQDGPGGSSHVEGRVHHDATSSGVSGSGDLGTDDAGTSGRAGFEMSGTADGRSSRAETDVRGEAHAGERSIHGEYNRTTTTDGDTTSDETTIGGGVRSGDTWAEGGRTVSHEQTASTETDSHHVEAEVGHGATSTGFEFTQEQHRFDTDEDQGWEPLTDGPDGLLGSGRTEDHENTTEVSAHHGDHEASIRLTEGYDLDGTRGEGWTGNEFGADYVEREWSSEELRVDGHVVEHERVTTRVVDNNPLDGDLEDSSTYRERVGIDGVDAEVRVESSERFDVNPLDGDVGHERSSHRGVEIDGVEVSQSTEDHRVVDTDITDGDVGVSGGASTQTVVGDAVWSSRSEHDTSVGTDGVEHTDTSGYRGQVGGATVEGERTTEFHADATGAEYRAETSASGPTGSHTTSGEVVVDTDVTDGDVGVSGSQSEHLDVGGVATYDSSGSTESTVDAAGARHASEFDSSGSVGGVSGHHEASAEARFGRDTGFEAESSAGIDGIGGVEAGAAADRHGAEASLDGTVGALSGDGHAQVDRGGVDVGATAEVADVGGVHGDAQAGPDSAHASAGASFLDNEVDGEAHAGQDGAGVSGSGTVLGVTITGSADTDDGVAVGIDTDGDGENETPGEAIDDGLGALGNAAEDTGEALGDLAEDTGDALGDLAEDTGEAISDFLSGGSDDDDDDDDDDGGSIGDVVDHLLGWG